MNLDYLYYRGRVAMSELLTASGVVTGDFVAIQAYTCSAVPESVFAVGAKPLYIDIEEGGVTMSSNDLELKLKSCNNVKALIIQHTFGVVANIKELVKIAKRHNMIVIEDCCHTHSSRYQKGKVGDFSDASFYSFEWGKPLPLGIGGAVKVNNQKIFERLEDSYGRLKNPLIVSEFQLLIQRAAFSIFYSPKTYWTIKYLFHLFTKYGLIQGNQPSCNIEEKSEEFSYKISRLIRKKIKPNLYRLEFFESRGKQVVQLYKEKLLNLKTVKEILTLPESDVVYVRYPIWLNDKEAVMELAYKNRVEVSDWYSSPIHPYSSNQLTNAGYILGSCPNAELSSKHIVSLPLSHIPSKKFMDKLIKILQ